MPITYYTQDEVDVLVEQAINNITTEQNRKSKIQFRYDLRNWIMYDLRPEQKTAKQLREALEHFRSNSNIPQ